MPPLAVARPSSTGFQATNIVHTVSPLYRDKYTYELVRALRVSNRRIHRDKQAEQVRYESALQKWPSVTSAPVGRPHVHEAVASMTYAWCTAESGSHTNAGAESLVPDLTSAADPEETRERLLSCDCAQET